jgi:hypothetical protein
MTDTMSAEHELPTWATTLGASAVTAFAGFLIWLLKRTLGAPTAQHELNSGFVDLFNEMRLELDAACHQRTELRDLLATEKRERLAERQQYRGEINQLRAIVDGLERLLRRNGIDIPPRKTTAEPAKIVDATLSQDGQDED